MEISTPVAPAARAPRLLAMIAFAAGLIGIVSAATPEWHGRLSLVREYLSTATPNVADGLVVASSLVHLIDGSGRMIGKSRSPYTTRQAVNKTIAGPSLIGFHHPAAAIRKSVLQSVGGYRQQCWPAEDLDLWNRIAEKGHMMLVQTEYLMQYRVHASSISISAGRHQVLTIDWVEELKNRRRAGLPEITFAEFIAARDQRPTDNAAVHRPVSNPERWADTRRRFSRRSSPCS